MDLLRQSAEPGDRETFFRTQILFWLLGGLEDRTWEHVLIASPALIAAGALWPLARSMDLLSLGVAEAQSLGVDVRQLRRRLLGLSTIMTALATALALIPLALGGDKPGNEIQTPMAVVILCGLLTSMFMNMILVPALYLRFGERIQPATGPA